MDTNRLGCTGLSLVFGICAVLTGQQQQRQHPAAFMHASLLLRLCTLGVWAPSEEAAAEQWLCLCSPGLVMRPLPCQLLLCCFWRSAFQGGMYQAGAA